MTFAFSCARRAIAWATLGLAASWALPTWAAPTPPAGDTGSPPPLIKPPSITRLHCEFQGTPDLPPDLVRLVRITNTGNTTLAAGQYVAWQSVERYFPRGTIKLQAPLAPMGQTFGRLPEIEKLSSNACQASVL